MWQQVHIGISIQSHSRVVHELYVGCGFREFIEVCNKSYICSKVKLVENLKSQLSVRRTSFELLVDGYIILLEQTIPSRKHDEYNAVQMVFNKDL